MFWFGSLLLSCGGGSDNETPIEPVAPVVVDPSAVSLIFPEDNSFRKKIQSVNLFRTNCFLKNLFQKSLFGTN